jgi:hypothetical protein
MILRVLLHLSATVIGGFLQCRPIGVAACPEVAVDACCPQSAIAARVPLSFTYVQHC